MRSHSLILVLLPLPFALMAQNWKTVSDKDTVYFAAGSHKVGFANTYDSNILRAIWVDSSRLVNSDSVFYFYPAFRSAGIDSCIDTLAATWLGARFIRSASGTEYFFNSMGDTIIVKTMAAMNDSWVMATNAQGLVFKANVSSVGTMMIDNIADSFKIITIQAYLNNIAVANEYNNKALQISKAHGWVKTIDLWRFPNNTSTWEDFGALVDSTEHRRLDRNFKSLDLARIDLAWKYAAGNEWIKYTELGDLPYTVYQRTVTFDSVISSLLLSPDTIVVTMKTDEFAAVWPVNQVTTNSWLHTDTISNMPSRPLIASVLPEYNGGTLSQDQQRFFKRYFTDTFCNTMQLINSYQFDGQPLDYGPCWSVGPGVSGQFINDTSLLPGFGLFSSNEEVHNTPPFSFAKTFYSYLHLGLCTWGTKINVIALGLNNVNVPPTSIIYPNPAKDKVYIQTGSGQQYIISLYDITGRLLVQKSADTPGTELPLTGYSSGIYILSVKAQNSVVTYKLQIE